MSKKFYLTDESISGKFKRIYRKKGIWYIVPAILNVIIFVYLKNYFWHYYYRFFRRFRYQGRAYGYFYHPYNQTWENERSIEIPIIWSIVRENKGKEILEVGNVLSHYFKVNHDIIDKYEKADGVINVDIVDYKPKGKYDLIVSVSTLEHVGYDEKPRDPKKILKTIVGLKKILNRGGKIIVTLPLGQNPSLDALLDNEQIKFRKKKIFRKRFPLANGLLIGEVQ